MKNTLLALVFLLPITGHAAESTCYGTTKNGRLENAVKLPGSGKNFTSYGTLPEITGRTWVHSTVNQIVIDAYKSLETELPGKVFKYAETGFKHGGKFSPHKTHQNGLSIDFMVPVVDSTGKSVHLPTNPLNRYGYDIEFDNKAKFEDYSLDFEALGAHIVALHKASKRNDTDLWRVIFDPELQPRLYATKYGNYIKNNVLIPKKRSWVRHDDHYHVDFKIKCKPLNSK